MDDEPVGLTVRKLLLERKGYAVETASNGPSAIDLFKVRPFDLVLLDYYMPAMNGAEVARAMRQIRPHARIVMLSAYVSLPEEALQHVRCFHHEGNSSGSVAGFHTATHLCRKQWG